ncbi:MAG: DUF3078 domain-containing protein [Bacteroidales bacterium]|nr:DUF3078 domain-containing protein [Bacteroidales bacterium]
MLITNYIHRAIILLLLTASSSHLVFAQSDSTAIQQKSPWKLDGTYMFNISESTFTNWVAGGTNQIGLATILKPHFVYDNGKLSWSTEIDIRYGLQKQQNSKSRKTEDVLKLETKLGKRLSEDWKFSGLYTISTQFSPSMDGDVLNSAFAAPAYTNLSLGFDYNPKPQLSIYMTPGNIRSTYVFNDTLSSQGAFGVSPGKKYLIKFGPSFLIGYKGELLKNFLVDTKLGVFMNVLDGLGNPVVNWDAIITMKINRYLATTFAANLFFDPDSKVNIYDADGVVTGKVAKIQFKQSIGFGVNIKW